VSLGILVPLSKIDVHLPVTFDDPGIKVVEKYRKVDRLIKIPSMFAIRPYRRPVVHRNHSPKITVFRDPNLFFALDSPFDHPK
jgi:hypothetical protein